MKRLLSRRRIAIVILAICCILVALIFFKMNQSKQLPVPDDLNKSNIENSEDSLYFFTYEEIEENDSIYNSYDQLENFKEVNRVFHEEYNFYELSMQPVYYEGKYKGNSDFCVISENGVSLINQNGVDIDGNNVTVTPLKTVILDSKFCNNFDDLIYSGRNFCASDFTVSTAEQEVNVLMGYQYRDIYSIGDVIKLSLFEKDINFKVIGFLKQNTSIYTTVTMTQEKPSEFDLDYSIIIPYYDISYSPSSDNELIYQTRFYTQKNSGYIKIDERIHTDNVSKEEIAHFRAELNESGLVNPYVSEYLGCIDNVESISQQKNLSFSLSLSPVRISFESE